MSNFHYRMYVGFSGESRIPDPQREYQTAFCVSAAGRSVIGLHCRMFGRYIFRRALMSLASPPAQDTELR
jgi:hypothetical protein